ncbi:larval cuticle protein 65Ag1-like [Calliphora vicina]|uniref:larval cuticle protein 65Ag1-like n=1 Tax=Calliphora vicina TaxID=7373 RepID=UPI00325C297C
MKYIIVFAALFAVALARPNDNEIIRMDNSIEPEGFKFAVQTSDGSVHTAEGELKDVGTEHEGIAVHGSFSFVADDGKTYTVDYVADENGFQPQGAHLPNGPGVQ